MALSEDRYNEILAYCREDVDTFTPEEYTLFRQTCLGQMSYLRGAGILPPCEGVEDPTAEQEELQALYDLALNALVLDAWDKRDAATDKEQHDNPALRRVINQLKLRGGGRP